MESNECWLGMCGNCAAPDWCGHLCHATLDDLEEL